jgi:hypothetical protein
MWRQNSSTFLPTVFNPFVPNQRRPGQIFVGCQADEQLIADLDRARGRKDRSQFIREAIAEKLESLGIRVPERLIYLPPRAKVIQIVGDNNQNVTLRAAEGSPKYRVKKSQRR